jgi:hypothetical protein
MGVFIQLTGPSIHHGLTLSKPQFGLESEYVPVSSGRWPCDS